MKDTRRIILDNALHLFNRSGVIEVSTNHISAALSISPGVLYYHFRNRESIVRELFSEMTQELETMWSAHKDPREFFELSLQVFWKYRCFHREMVPLRRRDPMLNRLWFIHIRNCQRLMNERIMDWSKASHYPKFANEDNRRLAIIVLLTVGGSVLQTFESSLKKPRANIIDQSVQTLLDCLVQLGS